jgi:hypothetical protein
MRFHDNNTRYVRDDAQNFTEPNGKMPTLKAARTTAGLNDSQPLDDNGRAQQQPASPSSTSGVEPSLPGQDQDILDRLTCLEMAVAQLAVQAGGDPDDGDDDNGSDNPDPDPDPQVSDPGSTATINDSLPSDDIEQINSKNAAFYGVATSVSAMGSPDTTPAPGGNKESERVAFMPNRQNSINGPRRLSETKNSLDPGTNSANSVKAFGTNDTQRRASVYTQQRVQANQLVGSINQRNAKFYARRGA